MAPGTQKPDNLYQMKITLTRSHPPICCRIQVQSDITLATLHGVVQVVTAGAIRTSAFR